MKTLKKLPVSLESSATENIAIKSISLIEKTYFTIITAAFVLTIASIIKDAML